MMSTFFFLLDLSLAAFCCSIGLVGGWWLRSRGAKPDEHSDATAEREFAQSILTRVQEVAQRVAKDMGQHSTRVQEISDELAEGGENSPESVMAAINNLVASNGLMQQQLDLAERTMKSQAEQIQAHATAARTDALTKLANRRALDVELADIVSQPNSKRNVATIMICDVDHFKKFNDTHGHLAGDEVLRGVARVLASAVREVDFVARYGGEEFAILFPGTPWQEAAAVAERVRAAVAGSQFEFENTLLQVTVSLGIAQYSDPEGIENWVQRADEGLYVSKEAGRNCGYAHDGKTMVALEGLLKGASSAAAEPTGEEESDRNQDGHSQSEEMADQLASALEDSEGEQHATDPLADETDAATPAGGSAAELVGAEAFSQILQMRLAEFKRGGAQLALLMLEIDNLEQMSRERGPDCGSVVMRATSQFLQATMREMDVVSRIEGGKFALLLPDTSLEDALHVAERLRRATSRCKLEAAGDQFYVTISLGVTMGCSTDAAEECLGRAQTALNQAARTKNLTCLHDGESSFAAAEHLTTR